MKLSPTVTVGVTVFSSIFRLDNVRWQFFSYLQIPMKTEPLHHPLCINSQLLERGGNTIGPESEIVFQLRCLAPNTCSLRFFPLIISNLVAYFREKKKIGPRMSSKDSVQFNSFHSLSRVRLFATPWIAAHQSSLSITNSRSLLKLMSI